MGACPKGVALDTGGRNTLESQGRVAVKERLENLVNQTVEVIAGKMRYTGVLKEVSEREVQLQMESGWMTITMDKVNDIRRAGAVPGPDPTKDIPPDFYKEK